MGAVAITYDQAFTCCSCKAWAAQLQGGGPYDSLDALLDAARRIWYTQTPVTGWLEAFSAHPKIGERKEKPGAFGALSKQEQAAAAESATAELANELQDWNVRYAEKFGHIFIICAKGRSTAAVLSELKARFKNSPQTELSNAAREQMAITELRILATLGAATASPADAQVRAACTTGTFLLSPSHGLSGSG